MKNKKTIIIASGIILFGLIAYFVFNQLSKSNVTIQEKNVVPKVVEGGSESKEAGAEIPVIEIDEVRKMSIEEEMPFSMEEYTVQDLIHGMSHQKIRADDKWGFLPMTQERVSRLIVVVEANNLKYDDSDLYLKILNRWLNNDFSRVDLDHNAIWELQGGNVGRATGILTVEEEKAFIKKNFNTQIKK
jgi:hypothetical protein